VKGRWDIEESEEEIIPKPRAKLRRIEDSEEDNAPKTRKGRWDIEDSEDEVVPKPAIRRRKMEESGEEVVPKTGSPAVTPPPPDNQGTPSATFRFLTPSTDTMDDDEWI
jgi:hypothetical protein